MGRNRKRKDRWQWGVQTPAQMRTKLARLIETMNVPEDIGVKKAYDITWLQCHLRENNPDHPFVEEAVKLCIALLVEYRRSGASIEMGSEGPAYKDTFE